MHYGKRCAIAVATIVVTACGTTSNIKPEQKSWESASAAAPGASPGIDLSSYDKVAVLDFTDATDKSKMKADAARSYSDTMASAVRAFPDLIAQKIRDTGAFQEVVRGPSAGKTLVISGRITRLVEGNGALRLLVGMGAGSSYFDATTDLADGESGSVLGHITTDKNSWALGGGLAATQTVQSFMQGAAEKIAQQLRDGRKGAKKSPT